MSPLRLLASLGLLVAAVAGAARADDDALGAAREQHTATVGFYVFNVRDLDVTAHRFKTDFYFWMRYRGERSPEIEQIEFANGHVDSREELERRDLPTGEHYACWRITGTFQARFELRDYPLDRQRLEIIIENPALEADQLAYAHDIASYTRSPIPPHRWGIKNGLIVPEFRVTETERPEPHAYAYETDFGHVEGPADQVGSRYSRLVLAIKLERIAAPYLVKLVLPFLLILATAYMTFWVPPQDITASVALAMLALLSCIAFQIAITQHRPETGSLVLVDKFFIASVLFIVCVLIETVLSYDLLRAGRDELAFRLDVAARVVFPIAFGGVFALLLWTAGRAG